MRRGPDERPYPVAYPCGLTLCGRGLEQSDVGGQVTYGPQTPARRTSLHECPGGIEHARRRTVVGAKRHHREARPCLIQCPLHVAVRPPETVDGLVGVADAEEPFASRRQQGTHEGELQRREVLYLVHQHMTPRGHIEAVVYLFKPEFQQIRIVGEVPRGLLLDIAVEKRGQRKRTHLHALAAHGQFVPCLA